MSCGLCWRCGLAPVLLWLWHKLAAAPPIEPLAWELPYAVGAALKNKKKKNEKNICNDIYNARKQISSGNLWNYKQNNHRKHSMNFSYSQINLFFIIVIPVALYIFCTMYMFSPYHSSSHPHQTSTCNNTFIF